MGLSFATCTLNPYPHSVFNTSENRCKIQGQMGEDVFVRLVGSTARLAANKSQEGWDVWVIRGDYTQYVQVKVYADADGVGSHLRKLQERLQEGTIRDGEIPLKHLDIAINSEIYDEVRAKAAALNYQGDILDLGETRATIRDALKQSVDHVKAPFEHFFGELFGDMLQPALLHAVANAFLLYKGAKDRRTAVEDTFYSAGITAGACSRRQAPINCWDMDCSGSTSRMRQR
jgi:hypothetical protein